MGLDLKMLGISMVNNGESMDNHLGMSENVGLIFPMIASHFS